MLVVGAFAADAAFAVCCCETSLCVLLFDRAPVGLVVDDAFAALLFSGVVVCASVSSCCLLRISYVRPPFWILTLTSPFDVNTCATLLSRFMLDAKTNNS